MCNVRGEKSCRSKGGGKNVVGCILRLSNHAHELFQLLPLLTSNFIFYLEFPRRKVIYVEQKVRKIPGSENFRKISGNFLKILLWFCIAKKIWHSMFFFAMQNHNRILSKWEFVFRPYKNPNFFQRSNFEWAQLHAPEDFFVKLKK